MFVIGNLLLALAHVLDPLLTILMWLVVIRALLSWVNPDPYNPLVRILYSLTDPLLNFIRIRLPLRIYPLDLSPIILILFIIFLKYFLISTLIRLGYELGGSLR